MAPNPEVLKPRLYDHQRSKIARLMSEERNFRGIQAVLVLHNPVCGLFLHASEPRAFFYTGDPSVRSVGTVSSVLGHKAVPDQLEKVMRLRRDR
jgi:hypothetical protein